MPSAWDILNEDEEQAPTVKPTRGVSALDILNEEDAPPQQDMRERDNAGNIVPEYTQEQSQQMTRESLRRDDVRDIGSTVAKFSPSYWLEKLSGTHYTEDAAQDLAAGAAAIPTQLASTAVRLGGQALPYVVPGLNTDAGRAAADATDMVADDLNRYSEDILTADAQVSKEDSQKEGHLPDWARRNIRGLANSVPKSLLAGGTSAALGLGKAGAGWLMAGMFGTDAGNQAITEGRDAGLKGGELAQYALEQGGLEAGVQLIFNKIPGMAGIEDANRQAFTTGVKDASKNFLRDVSAESLEEFITGVGQEASKKLHGLKKDDIDYYRIGLDSVIGSAGGKVAAKGVGRLSEFLSKTPEAAAKFAASNGSRQAAIEAGFEVQTTKAERMAALEKLQTQNAPEETSEPYTKEQLDADLKKIEDNTPNLKRKDTVLGMPEAPFIPEAGTRVGYRTPGIETEEKTPQIVESLPTDQTVDTPAPEVKAHKSVVIDPKPVEVQGEPVYEHKFVESPAEMNEKKWYHGTGTEGMTAERLDPNLADIQGLFGNGIYLTDNPKVAEGYAKARGKKTGKEAIYRAKVNVENVINLEKPVTPDVVDAIANAAWDESISDAVRAAAAKPNATGESIYQAMRNATSEFSHDSGTPLSEFYEQFQTLAANLRELGYDAFTHTGGKRVGKKEGLHQVLILLDPNDTAGIGKGAGKVKEFGPRTSGVYKKPPVNPVESSINANVAEAPKLASGVYKRQKAEAEAAAQEFGKRTGDTTRVGFKAAPKAEEGKVSYKLNEDAPEYKLNREHVQKTFAGTDVKPTEGGYRVTFKGGNYLDVKQTNKIEVDWAQAVKQLGKKITPAMKKQIVAAGSFELKSKDGKTISGLGLIQLANGKATESTLPHEAMHFAKQMGLFTEQEWSALKEKYAKDAKGDVQVEEAIADARGSWSTELVKKIQKWATGLMEKVGLTKNLTGEEVMQLMDQSAFWERVPKTKNGVKSVQLNFGRPELAKPAQSPEGRAKVDFVDQNMKEANRPEKDAQKESDWVASAKKSIADNGVEVETERILKIANEGKAFNPVDANVAEQLIDAASIKAAKSGKIEDKIHAVALIVARRQAGSQAGRDLRALRDKMQNPKERLAEVLAELYTPPDAMYQLILKAEKSGDKAKADKLRERWAKEADGYKEKLKQRGWDIDDEAKMSDPKYAARAFKELTAVKSSYWDAFKEMRYGAMLSNPSGMAADVLSNSAHVLLRRLAVRPIEMTINKIFGRKAGAQLGEFKHFWGGLRPAFTLALKNTLETMKTEDSQLERKTGREAADAFDSERIAIGTPRINGVSVPVGRIVRAASTVRRMTDEFIKSMIARAEVGAVAFRIAQKEKLTGEALEARIKELVDKVDSEAWTGAVEEAQLVAAQTPLSENMKQVQGVVNMPIKSLGGIQPGNLIMPFFKVSVNLFKTGMRYTPGIGALDIPSKIKNADPKVVENIAQQIVGSIIMGLAWQWLEEGRISGNLPSAEGARDASFRAGGPTTIRIGDKTFNYGRIEPIGTTLPVLVDAYKALKSEKGGLQGAADVLAGIAQQSENKTFMRGLADIHRFVDKAKKGTVDSALADFGAGQISSLVPSAIKQVQRASQENLPERKADTADRTFGQRVKERALEADGPAAIDLFGREKKRSEGNFAYKLLSPVDMRTVDDIPADLVLKKYNAKAAKPYNPEEPKPDITVNGVKKTLTNDEFLSYSRLAGTTARTVLARIKLNTESPTDLDVKIIEDTLAASRNAAKVAYSKGVSADKLAKKVFDDLKDLKKKAENEKKPLKLTPLEKSSGMTMDAKVAEWRKDVKAAKFWLAAMKK